MFRSLYSVYCLCVNVSCTAPTECQPNCSYIYIYIYIHVCISYRKVEFITFYLNIKTNGIWGSRGIVLRSLNIATRWSWAVSIMSGSVYPCKRQTISIFTWRPDLAWTPRKSDVTYPLSLTGVGTRTLGRPAVFGSVRLLRHSCCCSNVLVRKIGFVLSHVLHLPSLWTAPLCVRLREILRCQTACVIPPSIHRP
jgi:hypothetical protein